MAKDFLLKDFDLQIVDGDFVVGDCDQQNVELVLLARPGDYKQSPFLGVGIEDYVNAPTSPRILEALERNIKLQLESDGAIRPRVKVRSIDNIDIEAKY